MSKHREALRRGIRSLIQETSRELADLEGREPPQVPEAETPPRADGAAVPQHEADDRADAWRGGPAASEGPAEKSETAGEPDAALEGAGPDREPEALHDAEVLAVEVRELGPAGWGPGVQGAPPPAPPEPPEAGSEPRAGRPSGLADLEGRAQDEADGGEARWSPPRLKIVGPAAPEDAVARGAPAADATPSGRKTHPRPARAKSRARKPRARVAGRGARPGRRARRARRPAGDTAPLDAVDLRQVHSRKGVCTAYVVNRECWRVSDAYCNTALHVCAMRDCPVYHLYREAMERRFAAKFKHLW